MRAWRKLGPGSAGRGNARGSAGACPRARRGGDGRAQDGGGGGRRRPTDSPHPPTHAPIAYRRSNLPFFTLSTPARIRTNARTHAPVASSAQLSQQDPARALPSRRHPPFSPPAARLRQRHGDQPPPARPALRPTDPKYVHPSLSRSCSFALLDQRGTGRWEADRARWQERLGSRPSPSLRARGGCRESDRSRWARSSLPRRLVTRLSRLAPARLAQGWPKDEGTRD